MSAEALSDQVDRLRRLLREAVQSHPGPLPNRVAVWWDGEQLRLSEEAAAAAARAERRRTELASKIAALQAELDAL